MSDLKEIAYTKLTTTITNSSLRDLVEWIDLEYVNNTKVDSILTQIITRSNIAIGEYLLENEKLNNEQRKNISNTIQAAKEYVIYPNESNYNIYFSFATDSYPFGVGEGCYSVAQKTENNLNPCVAGTGCRSGAGSLIIFNLDEKITFKVISKNLVPWLKSGIDPVLDNL